MKKRLLIFTACVGLLLMLTFGGVASYRNNLFGLQDMLLRSTANFTRRDAISLAGIQGSPEFLAAREWLEFTAAYDLDGAQLQQAGNDSPQVDARFELYFVYTQEMADELDEIIMRHSLQLHSSVETLHSLEQLYGRLGGDLLPETYVMMGGYIYESNSFLIDGFAYLGEHRGVSFQFMHARRGFFSEVLLYIGDAESYETWHINAGGQPLLLALGPETALVVADTGQAFVTINVLAGQSDREYGIALSKADLEAFARGFDFSALQ